MPAKAKAAAVKTSTSKTSSKAAKTTKAARTTKTAKSTKSPKVTKVTPVSLPVTSTTSLEKSMPKIDNKYIIAAVVLLVLLGLAYVAKSVFVAALVNGKPVSRLAIIRELEKQQGSQVLDSLITKMLIEEEAKKQNVTVPESEIDGQMATIEDQVKKSGQELDQLLAARSLTREKLREEIRTQKLVEKLAGGNVVVTDEEVKKYLEDNKAYLPEGVSQAELEQQARQQLEDKNRTGSIQTWIQSLRQSANIQYFVQY